jgi:hypothetical protein
MVNQQLTSSNQPHISKLNPHSDSLGSSINYNKIEQNNYPNIAANSTISIFSHNLPFAHSYSNSHTQQSNIINNCTNTNLINRRNSGNSAINKSQMRDRNTSKSRDLSFIGIQNNIGGNSSSNNLNNGSHAAVQNISYLGNGTSHINEFANNTVE